MLSIVSSQVIVDGEPHLQIMLTVPTNTSGITHEAFMSMLTSSMMHSIGEHALAEAFDELDANSRKEILTGMAEESLEKFKKEIV